MAETTPQKQILDERLSAIAEITKAKANYYRPIPKPTEDGIGAVMWGILGGENADLDMAVELLHIPDRHTLRAYISGRKRPTQQFINENKWRETFAEHYSVTWFGVDPSRHKTNIDAFNEYAAMLKEWTSKTHEPEDKNTFGHKLWLVLGGKDADIDYAAEILGSEDDPIHPNHLSRIIHDRQKFSKEEISQKGWLVKLSQINHAAWNNHKDEFLLYADTLPERLMVTRPRRAGKAWVATGHQVAQSSQNAIKPQKSISKQPHRHIESKSAHPPKAKDSPKAKEFSKVKGLPKAKEGKTSYFPEEGTFGRALWNILGGEKINLEEAAERLSIAPAILTGILQNEILISQGAIAERYWKSTFMHLYKNTWEQKPIREEFEKRLKEMPSYLQGGFAKAPVRTAQNISAVPVKKFTKPEPR